MGEQHPVGLGFSCNSVRIPMKGRAMHDVHSPVDEVSHDLQRGVRVSVNAIRSFVRRL